MSDPRFTSGQVGNLTFAHMNSLFEFKDAVEGNAPSGGIKPAKTSNPFVAKVLAKTGTQYKWEEAVWNGSSFQSLANGRRSSDGVGDYAFPLISLNDITVGSYVVVAASVSAEATISRPICFPMIGSAAAPVFAARITAAAQIGSAPLRWRYNWQEVFVNTTGNGWSNGARTGQALNGAEWTANDGPLVYGVGMEIGATSTAVLLRKAIRTDVIVMMSEQSAAVNGASAQFWFSTPNGYKVTC